MGKFESKARSYITTKESELQVVIHEEAMDVQKAILKELKLISQLLEDQAKDSSPVVEEQTVIETPKAKTTTLKFDNAKEKPAPTVLKTAKEE